MIKLILLLLSFLFKMQAVSGQGQLNSSVAMNHGSLKVSENKRYLQHADGTPFFYLGDTGWELFHRLDRNEAIKYLDNRAGKGFDVIQAVALAEMNGLNSPNAYGDLPMKKDSSFVPEVTTGSNFGNAKEYDYWDHVAYIVEEASKRNLYIGLLPCWGEYVTPRFTTVVFDTPLKGYNYGWFIGNRMKNFDNIIWILGGDRLPDERFSGIGVWRAMAEGITDALNGSKVFDGTADYSTTLMSYHCFYPSSIWFMDDPWIDFNMWGSYHEKANNDRAFEIANYQWNISAIRPTLNGEPPYENATINYNPEGKFGYFDDFDVRQQAYWSVFAGCMGHTYGSNSVWSMNDPQKRKKSYKGNAWYYELDLPGSTQLKYLKMLIESRPFYSRHPADSLLTSNTYDLIGQLKASAGEGYIMVYVPTEKKVEVQTSYLKGKETNAWWYNPRDGKSQLIGKFENEGTISFEAPGKPERGNDWVLVLDDASFNYLAPGSQLPIR